MPPRVIQAVARPPRENVTGSRSPFRSSLPESKRDAYWHPLFDAPTGIRTPVLGLKGPRPSPLDDGGAGRILPCALKGGQRFGLRRG
jgi:hypothetical protein